MENCIRDVEVMYYKVPLKKVLYDAMHGMHSHFELSIVKVTLEEGQTGIGYTYTGGYGAAAITKMIEADCKPLLIDKPLNEPSEMTDFLNRRIHYVARGGIASFALSALDIAFWDIKAKKAGLPIAKLIGMGNVSDVKTYYGGIDLGMSKNELLENLENQLKNGHTALKIKIGKKNEQEDIDRVSAVRDLLGREATLIVDVNMVWSIDQAIRMSHSIEKFDILWLEEPSNPDDYEGYAHIVENSSIPLGMGENMHTIYEHKMAMDIARVKYPIADASNCLGISGFLNVAQLAKQRGLTINSHGMQELHVNILGGLDNRGYLEFHSFPIYEYTIDPIKSVNGQIQPSKVPGIGVSFNWEKLKPYRVC